MKWQIGMIGIAALFLCGCSEGNPNGSPYADEPGGTIAAPPQNMGVVSYDPMAEQPPFEDEKAGSAAIPRPLSTPMPAQ